MSKGRKSADAWKELYKIALLETDRTKVSARVAEAHAAISLQLNSLASSASSAEYAALKDAQKFLCLLEKEELRGRRPWSER
jgi:hypothetical protein